MDGYIQKPIDAHEMTSTIEALMRRMRS
jgi:DNA-binding response OmpR family regulator